MAEGALLAVFAVAVFVAVLALFAAEKVHRPPAALMGPCSWSLQEASGRKRRYGPSTGRPWGF